jgi:hypothetical protein
MAKKKAKTVSRRVNSEDNFRFALNAAVLAVLLGVLIMLVQQIPLMQQMGSQAWGY